jgi:thiamine phosphate synthase YjbQ (UPF0047 family)
MSIATARFTVELTPSSRVDVIDIKEHVHQAYGDILSLYSRALYCSYHTTAGFYDQSLCDRLGYSPETLQAFLSAFQELFPPGAEYRHDQLHLRSELSEEERSREPRNADSHLQFIGSGLENCVTYLNRPDTPVYFVELDGINEDTPRRRRSTVIGFNHEVVVDRLEVDIPVSTHSIDSISLKDARIGIYDRLQQLIDRHGIKEGWVEIDLFPDEHNTGLTVNEYETLLMKHDLADVLRDPLRFVAEKGRNMLRNPRQIPGKAKNYAKYDLVRVMNRAFDKLGLSESVVERIVDRLMALPASHFFGMKRSVRLLVTEGEATHGSSIVQGTYQSPILVQWQKAKRGSRRLRITLKQCT